MSEFANLISCVYDFLEVTPLRKSRHLSVGTAHDFGQCIAAAFLADFQAGCPGISDEVGCVVRMTIAEVLSVHGLPYLRVANAEEGRGSRAAGQSEVDRMVWLSLLQLVDE